MKKFAMLVAVLVCFAAPFEGVSAAQKFNEFKVKRIVSKNMCFKCHSITREKVGPAYVNVSKKFNEDPDGREKIHAYLTTSPEIEVEGRTETHVNLKTGGEKDLDEVINWLLSLMHDKKYKRYLR